MARAVIAFGSNLGDRAGQLHRAIEALKQLPGTRVLAVSSFIETEPVDVPPAYQALRFLNGALILETTLAPEALLAELNRLEAEAGRVRAERNGPRPLDLDIILYEGVRVESARLTLPHPRAHLRDFVLTPLAELGISREQVLCNCLPDKR
ncbi:MAG: 2-amino-4-hydroxy-6-hydroxymethyldihydropteridine diphosphokinase [Candidatus Spyradenecus sp.]